MKILRRLSCFLIVVFLVSQLPMDLPAKRKSPKKKTLKSLTYKYRKWITEEVGYITTKWEKQVFMQLETDRERDMFIAAFWKNRDPNPYTEENEFKIEHYKRLKFVEDRFAKGTPTPGWKTDQGRIYIILGQPHDIERHEGESEIYPVIIWFYQGLIEYGLPNAFSVVFFKEGNAGDYELYSPIKHGPHKLLVNYTDDTHDVLKAYEQLKMVLPSVAKVSMSLIEGDYLPGARPTIRSEILVSKQIVEAPTKRVNDEYARKLLKYKNMIDVEYSVNYIANGAKVKVLKDTKTGFYFVHYLVEPEKLSLEAMDDILYGNLEVNGSVFDMKGETVYQWSKNVPVRLKPDQMEKVKNKSFSFHDFFPLVAGQYRMEILIRNTSSKEFTSVERELTIPASTLPGVGGILMANTVRPQKKFKGNDKPFLMNGMQILASPRDDFTIHDTLHLFFQLHGLTEAQKSKGYFKYSIIKDDGEGKPLKTLKKSISEYMGPDSVNYLEKFPLTGLSAAYYTIRVDVYDGSDTFLFKGEGDFYITPMAQLKRPWIISVTTLSDGPENYNTLAIQYANKKDFKTSEVFLGQAYNREPTSAKLALNYCRVLFKLNKFKKIKSVGTPFLQTKQKNEFLSFLGFASANMGQYVEAITHFKEYLAYYGTNIKVLNAIGECYLKLGNMDEALVAWEKSVQLLPDQKKLKTKIKNLKKNKGKGETKNE
jgi:GWxTD domain-containing protein